MSTKVAISPNAVTEQASPTIFDGLRSAASSLSAIGPIPGGATAWAVSSPISRPAIHAVSEKATEAFRQIERVKSLRSLCSEGKAADKLQLESIASSIALIGSFLTSPMPIPVASSGSEGGTTLFFDDEGLYGDLEIHGNSVEYYIKSSKGGKTSEVFDSENIKDGYVPPRLLTCLFSHYAR